MRIMDTAQKVRENRVRNTARRQGLTLVKTRVRDPMATGYGTYQLVDETTGQRAAKDVDDDYSNEWDDRQRRPSAAGAAPAGRPGHPHPRRGRDDLEATQDARRLVTAGRVS